MLPKGIIFDLDDTIIQFDAVAEPTWRSVCEYFTDGEKILDSSLLLNAIDKTRKWFWSDKERHRIGRLDLNRARKTIVSSALKELSISDEILAESIVQKYSAEREEKISFFPKAENTLHQLNDMGISLVLVTNGQAENQRAKVDRFGLNRFFKEIFIEGELGFGKPEPIVYKKAIEELNFKSSDIWSVGDNLEWDVEGPQKFGVFGIWNDYKKRGLPKESKYKPDRIINRISELL